MEASNASCKHYVGIDPSLNGTGLAILTIKDGVASRHTLRIAPPQVLSETYKLAHIYNVASAFMVAGTPGDIAGVCIEGPSLGSIGRQDILGEVRGVLKLVMVQRPNVQRIVVVSPSTLKKFAAGHGSAEKEQVKEGMQALGWFARSLDEYDAAALAEFCYAQANDNPLLSRVQKEALVTKKKRVRKKYNARTYNM